MQWLFGHGGALALAHPVEDLHKAATNNHGHGACLYRRESMRASAAGRRSYNNRNCAQSATKAASHLGQHFRVGQASHEGGSLNRLHLTVRLAAGEANLHREIIRNEWCCQKALLLLRGQCHVMTQIPMAVRHGW